MESIKQDSLLGFAFGFQLLDEEGAGPDHSRGVGTQHELVVAVVTIPQTESNCTLVNERKVA